MSFNIPFRWKIALLLTAFSGSLLIGFGLVSLNLVRWQKLARMDTQIQALATRLPANPSGRGGIRRMEQSIEWILGGERAYLFFLDPSGRETFRSADWPDEWLAEYLVNDLMVNPPPAADSGTVFNSRRGANPGGGPGIPVNLRFDTLTRDQKHWRAGAFITGESYVWVLISLAPLESDMANLRARFLLILIPALALLAAGGWFIAGRTLRPLDNIASAADRIGAGNFSERIQRAGNAPEIDRIIGVLNIMLERLENSYQQALRFSADASHELKTPLAILQGTVEEMLRASDSDPERQQWCLQLMEEIVRLKRITANLLLLARNDAGQMVLHKDGFDLGRELTELVEDAEALRDPPVAIKLNIPANIRLFTDRQLFRTVVMNLLGNAVKYTGLADGVTVDANVGPSAVSIAISNGGPGIAAEDQPHVFNRFYRGRDADSENGEGIPDGHGLGLSLADEMAKAMGAHVALAESRPGMTRFEFTLPLDVVERVDESTENNPG